MQSNKTTENIVRSSKAMGTLHEFLAKFDDANNVRKAQNNVKLASHYKNTLCSFVHLY